MDCKNCINCGLDWAKCGGYSPTPNFCEDYEPSSEWKLFIQNIKKELFGDEI